MSRLLREPLPLLLVQAAAIIALSRALGLVARVSAALSPKPDRPRVGPEAVARAHAHVAGRAHLTDRTQSGLTQNIVAAVIVLLMLSSAATDMIGIHALFGAFLFGAALPKGSLTSALAEKIEDVGVVVSVLAVRRGAVPAAGGALARVPGRPSLATAP